MKTPVVARFVSLLAVVPTLLIAQPVRDRVPLRHWPAPLYWQPDHKVADFGPLATTPTDPNPLTFIAMTPCRVVDTRGNGFSGAFGPPSLVGGMSRTFPLQSSTTCSIPATAQAYSLNITVVPPGPLGYITVWPTGQSQPVVSTLNDVTGTVVANAAIVAAGTGGSIDIYASNSTDIVIDINGYYAASFGTPSAGYQFPNASGTALMTIAPTGNVGIGTATPASTLDVAGDINLSGRLLNNGTPILSVPSGFNNIALGSGALASNAGGSSNTATGDSALNANTTGFNNTATGIVALQFNTTGVQNTATGGDALLQNSTGFNNTANGFEALFSNTTGSNNIAIGFNAARNVSGGNSNNIHIGTAGAAADNGTIRIGGASIFGDPGVQTSFFVAGVRGVTTSNNDAVPVVIDSAGQLGTVSSSRRYKEDIQDMGDASNALMRLRPVTFRYQKPFADGSKPLQYGLIAEEVAEVYPDLVAHSADGQIETVKYQVLDSMLLNELQRQERVNREQKDTIRILEDRLSRLEARMASVASSRTHQ